MTNKTSATILAAFLTSSVASSPAFAEFDGPRLYWPLPRNSNAISMTRFDGRANLSFQLFDQYRGTLDVAPDVWVLGYTRNQPIFGRQTLWQALLPFGSLGTDSTLPAGALNSFADGIGDLQLGATINVLGAPDMMVKDFLRWDEKLSVNLGVQLTLPTGTYDSNEALNLGANRTSVRISAPIVYSLGDWVPGRRMTLEVMPAVRWFGDNDNSLGDTVSQEEVYSLEAHLTRDLTRESFFSLDYTYLNGGAQTYTSNTTGLVTGTSQGIDAHFLGLTFGMKINDNLSLNINHTQSVGGTSGPIKVNGALTRLQFVYSWHDVLEKRRDF